MKNIESKEINPAPSDPEAGSHSTKPFLNNFEILEMGLISFRELHPNVVRAELASRPNHWNELLPIMAEVRTGLSKLLERLKKTATRETSNGSKQSPFTPVEPNSAMDAILIGLEQSRRPIREALAHPSMNEWSKEGIKPKVLLQRLSNAILAIDDLSTFLKATGLTQAEMDLGAAAPAPEDHEPSDEDEDEEKTPKSKIAIHDMGRNTPRAEEFVDLFVEKCKKVGFPAPQRIRPTHESHYQGLAGETLYAVEPGLLPKILFQHCRDLLKVGSGEKLIVAQNGAKYRLTSVCSNALVPKDQKTAPKRSRR